MFTPRLPLLHIVSVCMASGLSVCSASPSRPEAKTPSPTLKATTRKASTAPKTPALKIKLIHTYRNEGKVWRSYLVPKGTTETQLIALARKYRRDFPKDNAKYFDDDRLCWDFHDSLNNPNSKIRFPVEWVNQHYLGMVNRMRQRDKNDNKTNVFKWQLSEAYGEKIALLE